MECEPVVLVLRDGFFVGIGDRSRRAHENFQIAQRRLRPEDLGRVRFATSRKPDRSRHGLHVGVIPLVTGEVAVQVHQREGIDT